MSSWGLKRGSLEIFFYNWVKFDVLVTEFLIEDNLIDLNCKDFE